jgi:hypothetical protein
MLYTEKQSSECVFRNEYTKGIEDTKRRVVGYSITIYRDVMVFSDNKYGSTVPPGVWFVAYTYATRNGARFGASPKAIRGKTLDEVKNKAEARKTRYLNKYYYPYV